MRANAKSYDELFHLKPYQRIRCIWCNSLLYTPTIAQSSQWWFCNFKCMGSAIELTKLYFDRQIGFIDYELTTQNERWTVSYSNYGRQINIFGPTPYTQQYHQKMASIKTYIPPIKLSTIDHLTMYLSLL